LSSTFNLSIVIPVHNESAILRATIEQIFAKFESGLIDLDIFLVENGSTDDSFSEMNSIAASFANSRIRIFPLTVPAAGLGHAYYRGMQEALKYSDDRREGWIMLTAADLPFGFSDYDAFTESKGSGAMVYIGSKQHERSRANMGFKRQFAALIFRCLRRLILGVRTRDTQGVFFVREDVARNFLDRISARDFFFTTELTYRLERAGILPEEIPVVYAGEKRPSSVRIIKHGTAMILQMMKIAAGDRNGAK
jgi:glycosyltransferase involved in cell wall biosynthesis